MLGFYDDRTLKEVLPKREGAALEKAFGYRTCGDLLLGHFPRAYTHHGSGVLADDAQEGDMLTCVAQVRRVKEFISRGGREITTVELFDGSTTFNASFFNSSYVSRVLHPGMRAMFAGKLTFFRGNPSLQHPDFLVFPDQGRKAAGSSSLKVLNAYGDPDELLARLTYVPVYPATASLASWRIMAATQRILDTLPPLRDPLDNLPPGMLSFDEALREIHFPQERGPEPARERLKYNEALTLGLVMALRRADAHSRTAPALLPRSDRSRAQLKDNLPFVLTPGQEEVAREISRDLASTRPMSRLLQGEVGSGKTVVSLLAMLQAVDEGRQCALLVPTEVLVTQHAQTLTQLLDRAGLPTTVVSLNSTMPTSLKRQALLDIVSGEADIVVGTHAIIQDGVEFFDLGLAVVDEQHRFGVQQRDRLRTKGREGTTPHLLVMTATPIPRTVAMTVFGDLEQSTLRELPQGRTPITSKVLPQEDVQAAQAAIAQIRKEIAAGRQAYVLCPRIEGEGGVVEFSQRLRSGPFSQLRVAELHGRIENKEEVMAAFQQGQIDILVATTVIEVGVDNPNATVMLIREAEAFGISQLHQLRGRVGRGGHASTCFFHTFAASGTPAYERLVQVAQTTDGFALAELDLQHRQEGDVLGTSQSGTRRSVKLLNFLEDVELITQAGGDAAALVEAKPLLAQRLVLDISRDNREFLEKS